MRDLSLIPGSEDPLEKGMAVPTPVFLPGEFHGQRSLVGYSPCGHTGSDVTEQLHTQDLGHSAVVIITGHPVQ